MDPQKLDRRTFNKLTAAALGGMMSGAMAGCGGDGSPAGDGEDNGVDAAAKHLCRGLNDCKGQGAEGTNGCRGMGMCATYAHHECGTHNACKGQGGCGEEVGSNSCKGEGGCAVPLMDHAWDEMRKKLEEKWKQEGVEYGAAPAKPAA